jgi:hypothetical protein
MAEETKEVKSPYVPFGTFLSFIDTQAEGGLPSTIDKSLMSKMSGGIQSVLLAALKGTGFIDDAGHPLPRFEQYVSASAADRKAIIREALADGFPYLLTPEVDLTRMTPGQFDKKVRDATGVSSSTLDKVASFFLGAAKHIGLPMSSHLEGRKPAFKSVKRPKPETPQTREVNGGADEKGKSVGERTGSAVHEGISDKALEYKLIDLMKEDGIGPEQMAAIWTLVQYLTAKGKKQPLQSSATEKDDILDDL